jgi:hypothetical protein
MAQSYTTEAQVVYLDFEGGFWGLQTHEGAYLQPTEPLPANLQQAGLELILRLEDQPNTLSYQMWGKPVKILEALPK